MKTLTKAISIVAISTFFAGAAMAAPQIEAADDSVTSTLCVTVASGSKLKLHKQIKASVVDKNYVANEMTCNGMSVATFVDQYGTNADNIKKYLGLDMQTVASVSYER